MGMTVSVHNTDPLEFTLYCISTGGPVTTVIWTKDSVELEGGVTVLDSGRFSRYTHSLNATEEGMYNCTVSNNQTSSATAELNITGMYSVTSVKTRYVAQAMKQYAHLRDAAYSCLPRALKLS